MRVWYDIYISPAALFHHGIKGMKWGVRRSREHLDKLAGRATMNLQLFGKRAKSRKTIRLDVREYAMAMSELRTHITDEEKKLPIIVRPIRNHIYQFENNYNDTYRIIGKRKIKDGATGLLKRDRYE